MTPRCDICGHLSTPHDYVMALGDESKPSAGMCLNIAACDLRAAMTDPAFLAHCKALGVDIGSVPEEERPFHLRAFRRVQKINAKPEEQR